MQPTKAISWRNRAEIYSKSKYWWGVDPSSFHVCEHADVHARMNVRRLSLTMFVYVYVHVRVGSTCV